MEKLTKEVLEVMSKEELMEAVETLQLKLEVAEKEIASLKSLAEIGKKYMEHLKAEALRLIKAVDGENTSLLKLIDKADADTLKAIVDEYTEKGKRKVQGGLKKGLHRRAYRRNSHEGGLCHPFKAQRKTYKGGRITCQ